MRESEQPNPEPEKEELIEKIKSETIKFGDIYQDVNWQELPDEYLEWFKKFIDGNVDYDELVNFINETNEQHAKDLEEYAKQKGNENVFEATEDNVIDKARSFLRNRADSVLLKKQLEEAKKNKT